MKKYCYCLFLIACLQIAKAQDAPDAPTTYYSKDFKWTLNVPATFEEVSIKDWAKIQHKGEVTLEGSTGQDIENNSKIIFVFRSDNLNYFESSYQHFDPAVDGNHLESIKSVNELMYQSFKDMMPGVQVKRSMTTEKVDGITFYLSKMEVIYPNKMVLRVYMFTHLFGKREFTANIMFVDEAKGKTMLDFWRHSKFGKSK